MFYLGWDSGDIGYNKYYKYLTSCEISSNKCSKQITHNKYFILNSQFVNYSLLIL